MEGLRRSIGWPAATLVLTCAALVMMPAEVSAVRYIVGANMGWTSNVNYTIWAQGKHFYLGDWLCILSLSIQIYTFELFFNIIPVGFVEKVFVYDRNQMNVLEVNKTDYENCNSDHPLQNWTTGAGRDVVPLNVTKTYYFISGKGFCYGGMKVAIHVEKLPPPPSSLPEKSGSPGFLSTFRGKIFVPTLFAIAAVWDSFLCLW